METKPPVRKNGMLCIWVQCKDCGAEWYKYRHNLPQWQGRCRSCAYKERFRDEAYRLAASDRAREQVLKQGGVPNAKKFTSERVRGAANHRWKGGVTPPNLLIRWSEPYKAWRKSVFERDNYTCVFCGRRGGRLNADHILPFADYPEHRLDIDNGRTLCLSCHSVRHHPAKG